MYTEVLQQLGLPKNEAKIYEALLDLGPANVSNIASASKVNRRNVYDSLKNLLNRRLVTRIASPKEFLYQAVEPNRLRNILKNQKQKISLILPELKKIYKKHIPEEQTFIARGTEGIKNFWSYVISQSDPVMFVGGKGAWHDSKIEEDRKKYFATCRQNGIVIKGIFDNEMKQSGQDIYSKYDARQIRFFPKEYSTKATYDICGDRVVLFPMPAERSVENSTIFNIVSRPLADSYRKWFEFLWQKAEMIK